MVKGPGCATRPPGAESKSHLPTDGDQHVSVFTNMQTPSWRSVPTVGVSTGGRGSQWHLPGHGPEV